MNILFFIIPKDETQYVLSSYSLRQVLEKMDYCGFTSLPIINERGEYLATITEGDILRFIKTNHNLSLKSAEKVNLLTIPIKRDIKSIKVYSNMEDLVEVALGQNFVPIVDDSNVFIGIVTRRSIISYFAEKNLNK